MSTVAYRVLDEGGDNLEDGTILVAGIFPALRSINVMCTVLNIALSPRSADTLCDCICNPRVYGAGFPIENL